METRSFRISDRGAGSTVAAALRGAIEGLAWNRARELCRRGKVHVNGAVETDAARRLHAGDEVAVAPHAPRLRAGVLEDAAIVHLDAHVVVVNKPAGVLSVAFDAGDRDTLADQLRAHLRRKRSAQGAELGVVQRLDKDTTGLLVFARTLAAKRNLQQQLRVHSIERRYLALVHGVLAEPRTIDTQLVRDRGDGLRGSFGHFRKPRGPLPADAQRALTHVAPIEALAGATLIECRLHTGRQHQIRIHVSELGHPVVGERVYIRDHSGPRIDAPRPMLHAAVLGFDHPAHGRRMRFEQEPPEDLATLLARLRAQRG
jgi:23S rRNA pseudouridine1911/1915/1917 synthase